jgi:hypothetical protein
MGLLGLGQGIDMFEAQFEFFSRNHAKQGIGPTLEPVAAGRIVSDRSFIRRLTPFRVGRQAPRLYTKTKTFCYTKTR